MPRAIKPTTDNGKPDDPEAKARWINDATKHNWLNPEAIYEQALAASNNDEGFDDFVAWCHHCGKPTASSWYLQADPDSKDKEATLHTRYDGDEHIFCGSCQNDDPGHTMFHTLIDEELMERRITTSQLPYAQRRQQYEAFESIADEEHRECDRFQAGEYCNKLGFRPRRRK